MGSLTCAQVVIAGLLLGGCGAHSAPGHPPSDGQPAVWDLTPGQHLSASTTAFTADVTRLACSGGFTGEVYPPEIRWSDAEVLVTFSVEPLRDGIYTCIGGLPVAYDVVLEKPLGDRVLVDGACLPGERAATTSFCDDDGRRFGG